MKLSKEEFIYLLRGVGNEWGPIEAVFQVENVVDALKTNTLEIEGYERTEWTNFDPNDPKTFPPVDKYCLLAQNERILGVYVPCPEWIVVDWRCVGELKYKGETVTHWRPLPPPPGKEAEAE